MCGIFGAIGWNSFNFNGVYSSLKERGPDDYGVWNSSNRGISCSLLHTRLAIQDRTDLGHQPMISDNEDIILVFNGEIYNKDELREILRSDGHTFKSDSDTEVILKGFQHWGDRLWEMLNGIFAIACWEINDQTLTLVRDRFGVKPLLLYKMGERCAFASELSTLMAAEVIDDIHIDNNSIESFSLWGSVSSPSTIIKQIEMIGPGKITKRLPNGQWKINEFSLSDEKIALYHRNWSLDKATREIEDMLINVVRQQSIGEYPVGLFLSGGIDSGLIASLLREHQQETIKSISIGFQGLSGAKDESALAKKTAESLEIEHTTIRISPSDLDESFDEFIDAIDQPSIDGLNSFLVTKAANKAGMRVCFSGLGADEIFGGYSHMENSSIFSANRKRIIKFHGLKNCKLRFHTERRIAKLKLGKKDVNVNSSMHKLSKLEFCGYLQDTLLRDSDSVTMAQGLELRVPFLDQDLVDLARSIPSSIHQSEGPKTILKNIARSRLPKDIIAAPKQGFNLALADWILSNDRFSPARIYWLIERALRAENINISKKSVYASWLLLKISKKWAPYWRWVVLGEWLAAHSKYLHI